MTTALFVASPALVQELLVDHADDYVKNRSLTVFARPVLGDGLVVSQDAKHRSRRSIVAPAFLPKRIARYADAIVEETDRVLATIPTQGEIDLAEEMTRLTLHVVASTLIHTEVADDVRRVGDAFTRVSQALMTLVRSFVPLPPSWPTRSGRKLLRAARELDQVVHRIIRERRARADDPALLARGSGRSDGDLLSLLMLVRDEAGRGLDDLALRDEVMTLLLAGHETTANALTWALQLVATSPEVARALQAEVDQVLGERPPRYDDLPRLSLCLQVFKETLRLYPPAYLVGRIARRESELAGYRIPRGQLVFVNIYGMQRRPELFTHPHSFRPERFDDQAERRWPKSSYIPFGVGPRVCVGNHFALMEGQLVLARCAQRLELTGAVARVAEAEPLVTLRPRGRVRMRVAPRAPLGQPATVAALRS
jgi:cytochrome P450